MRQWEAAELLGLSVRQIQHLVNRFRDSGAAGLVHLLRARPGNRRLPEPAPRLAAGSGKVFRLRAHPGCRKASGGARHRPFH
ncbi:helix-turn-helix domain-containing protein [Salmonella enterica]|uniref:helix-turn-helix domain-containing protein n=1 Tax=Salmonella enterica TaxID=28901 RepID=UPI00092F77B8|nr:helix-turn-helix domain-containing protein [Salmonella enterica]EBM9478507.1 helix-turn-helix domain-containing protein [Salmonella enterica subsp. enterica serovar Rubislaw]ECT6468322.1 hypothetical protein [Salmonella enterica subsp. enterica serovar Senegal]EHC8527881.1 helix-turn-helix domain-containing protein [Salmonella enterica subsp. enterica serovar 11:r:-]EAQ5803176.1 hypothetical protein [Salmonella enterica]EBO3245467.1 helix-turn-helix domain-containing protein [Salmonella ent